MRWISRVAILCYLAVLCTPHAFAVQDVRLSPLADSQLYAVSLTQQVALLTANADCDDSPASLPVYVTRPQPKAVTIQARCVVIIDVSSVTATPLQPRAPPYS